MNNDSENYKHIIAVGVVVVPGTIFVEKKISSVEATNQ